MSFDPAGLVVYVDGDYVDGAARDHIARLGRSALAPSNLVEVGT